MWNRKEIKQNAKAILKKNYVNAIIVALFISMASASVTNTFDFSDNSSDSIYKQSNDGKYAIQDTFDENMNEKVSEEDKIMDEYFAGNITFDEFLESFSKQQEMTVMKYFEGVISAIQKITGLDRDDAWLALAVVLLLAFVTSILISIFVLEVFVVSCKRWFIINMTDEPRWDELIYTFKNGYWNVVKIMFIRRVKIFLWTLCFIIPGVIKAYEYKMVPYLLAENPRMRSSEVFKESKILMDGNKWKTFIFEMSFLGWIFASMFTLGILGVLFVNPYAEIAFTGLYVKLCEANYNYKNDMQNNGYDNFYNYENNGNENNYFNSQSNDMWK